MIPPGPIRRSARSGALRRARTGAALAALAALVWLAGGGSAAAETCSQSGISVVDGACHFVGGVVSGCTPDCSDTFHINGTVYQIADFAMTGADGDALVVRNGGVWNANGFDLGYDHGGLRVLPGGSFSMSGSGFRQWAPTPSPTTQNEPNPWPIGQYVPCPDAFGATDCNGGDNGVVRFAYDPARPDADVAAALAALTTDDVVCGYFDPDTMGVTAASWTNSCFEVAAVDATCSSPADCFVEIELDQSVLDVPSPDYPLERRRVIESAIAGGYTGDLAFGGQPTANAEAGQRRLCVRGVSKTIGPPAIENNEDGVGRFLRFASADDAPLDDSQLINALEFRAPSCDALPGCDGDCHLVSIADPRGFGASHAAGERVWIDPGFLSTDRFAVLAKPPVLRGLHEPGEFAGSFQAEGQLVLRNAVAVDVGTFDLKGATIDALEWLFVSDATPSRNAPYDTQLWVFRLVDNTLNAEAIHHINVVGGPGFATCDNTAQTGPGTGAESCNSGLHAFMSRGDHYRFEDVSISHNDDDCMAGLLGGGGTLDVERLYCGPSGAAADTSNFIDLFDQGNHVLVAQDIICANCSNHSNGQAVAIFKLMEDTQPVSTLNRVSVVGAQGPFNETAMRESVEFSNLYLSGHRTAAEGRGPAHVDHFVVEDTHPDLDRPPATGAYWPASNLALLRNGIVRNSLPGGSLAVLEHPDDGLVENVLFLNVDKSTAGAPSGALVKLRVNGSVATGVYRDIAVAYQSGVAPQGLDAVFDAADVGPYKFYSVHGVLIADVPPSVGKGVATDDIGAIDSGRWCLFEAGAVDDAASFPPDTVWDQEPGFENPGAGDFRTSESGPCNGSGIRRGVDTPGVQQSGYYLSALHLSPKIVDRVESVVWSLSGVAEGGSIAFAIGGVDLVVATAPGQSAAVVAANVAAAIDANAELAAAGVTATASAGSVEVNDVISGAVVDDAGLNPSSPPVPALSAWGLALLSALLPGSALAAAALRRRRSLT